jgi:membrane fusion protein, macrolide-specific efflux system
MDLHLAKVGSILNHKKLIAIILLGVSGGYWAWLTFNPSNTSQERYTFATVKRDSIENLVTATGLLQPRDYVDVGTQVSGQLKKLNVEVGSIVKEGTLLALIDPTVYQTRVDSDQAQLRNQQAQLKDKRSQLILAEQQYARQKNLMHDEATTMELLQNTEASVRSLHAQIEALLAQLDQTKSALRGDQANLSYTKIYAPMSGTVVSIATKQGQTLNANQQAPILLRIADLSTMTVQTQVSEADVNKLKLGMETYFTTLGSHNQRWTSHLQKIEPTPVIQNNVVLYNALFDVPNANQKLMTQMTAQVFFVLASAKNTLVIPVSAITPLSPPQRNKAKVQLLNTKQQIEERIIDVGVSNRVQIEVVSGLQEGNQIVSGLRLKETAQKSATSNTTKPNQSSIVPQGMGQRMPH